jgi:hypothetical protein
MSLTVPSTLDKTFMHAKALCVQVAGRIQKQNGIPVCTCLEQSNVVLHDFQTAHFKLEMICQPSSCRPTQAQSA